MEKGLVEDCCEDMVLFLPGMSTLGEVQEQGES